MLNNSIFYWACVKNTITAFGDIFKNIRFVRTGEGTTKTQTIKVPLSYGPREKWLSRISEEPVLDNDPQNKTLVTLPRLSFEITGLQYDAPRKLGRTNQFKALDKQTGAVLSQFTAVPYNLNITLYCLTKTQEDALQIVEQIFPWFGPDYTVSINMIPSMGIVQDVPIILNTVTTEDDYEGEYAKRRSVTWTMNFTAKMQFFGPITDPTIIKHIMISIESDPNFQNKFAQYNADAYPQDATGPDTTSYIKDEWKEDF